MRQLPVNNSAPATSTENRPRQNARPPKMSEIEGASEASDRTMSMNDAPSATNAPARTARTNALPRVSPALANPMWTNASCVFAGGSITVPVPLSAMSPSSPPVWSTRTPPHRLRRGPRCRKLDYAKSASCALSAAIVSASSAARSRFFATTSGAALAIKPSLPKVRSAAASSFSAAASSFSMRARSASKSTRSPMTT